jgi:hypothetical protein
MNNTIFTKFFSTADVEKLSVIANGSSVVFIDTPATPFMVEAVKSLLNRNCDVMVRDHHDFPTPSSSREEEIHTAADAVRELIGSNAVISDRVANPACSSLIEAGEFPETVAPDCLWSGCGCPKAETGNCSFPGAEHPDCQPEEGWWVVADPDPDGLTATMKARGITYPELDSDAAVLDGGRNGQNAETLSPLGWLLARAMSTLPGFNPARPEALDDAKLELFQQFEQAVCGNSESLELLKGKVAAYEEMVAEATRLATTVTEVAPDVAFCDVREAGRFDLATLSTAMESRGKITAVLKKDGPISKFHGEQVSLAVRKQDQKDINLQNLLPEGFVSRPESGIISNTNFLLHVSPKVWEEVVLPVLMK